MKNVTTIRRCALWLLSALWPALCLPAQEPVQADTLSVKVYFRRGYSLFEPALRNNGTRLKAFVDRLGQAEADTLQEVGVVRIVGAASPEGTAKMNDRLAAKRAATLMAWLRQNAQLPGVVYESHSVGVDWDGLERLVQQSDMPYRDEVLQILRHTPEWVIRDGKVVDGRKRQLGMLRGGRAWRYMEEHFFPELRSAGMEVVCEIRPKPQPVPPVETATDSVPVHEVPVVEQSDATLQPDTAVPVAAPRERKPFYMALRTNMLYDALAVPNAGIEFGLKNGWTVGARWMYAWWKKDSKQRYWRTYGGELGIRKYFGRKADGKPFRGHHLGVYGQLLTYDFEWGGRGYLGDKWNWGAGIDYGYSLPVAKRLNIDFVIGLGYLGGEYKEYLPIDGHYVWQATKQRHWWGPTKAEVSLVWLLGHGNTNKEKGN